MSLPPSIYPAIEAFFLTPKMWVQDSHIDLCPIATELMATQWKGNPTISSWIPPHSSFHAPRQHVALYHQNNQWRRERNRTSPHKLHLFESMIVLLKL